jgi:hypothetical protein
MPVKGRHFLPLGWRSPINRNVAERQFYGLGHTRIRKEWEERGLVFLSQDAFDHAAAGIATGLLLRHGSYTSPLTRR